MVENIDQYFLKSKMTSLNVVFCAQLKDIQFTLTDSKDSQRERVRETTDTLHLKITKLKTDSSLKLHYG